MPRPESHVSLTLEVNGKRMEATVEVRTMLADLLREEFGLLGTRVGCGEGQCGACTVLLGGASARSCIVLAAQADGLRVTTVEGLASTDGSLSPIQQAFAAEHALQCGFCTSGMLIAVDELLRDRPDADDDEIRRALAGNLCRCTGYQGIMRAVRRVRDQRSRDRAAD